MPEVARILRDRAGDSDPDVSAVTVLAEAIDVLVRRMGNRVEACDWSYRCR